MSNSRLSRRTVLTTAGALAGASALGLALPTRALAATAISPNLLFTKTRNTPSGKMVVNSLTATSGFRTSLYSTSTYLEPRDAGNGWFQRVGRDLFFIKTRNTTTGKVEVHSATAASGYASGGHSTTYITTADADNGFFQMVGPDLFFIKTKNTGSGKIEVHSATASSGFQSAGVHSTSYLEPRDAANGWFQIHGSDLYFIKTRNTGSGRIEVHSATVMSGYQSAGVHSTSYLEPRDADNGWFQMVGADLYFIKTKNTGSGTIEVHSATGASGFQSAGLHSTSGLGVAEQGNGSFAIDVAIPRPDLGAAVAAATNAQRVANGLPALTVKQCSLPQLWALKLATEGGLSHNNISTVLNGCGGGRTAGENIASGYGSVAAVTAGWMGSSGHRANILNANFKNIFIGVAQSTNGTFYWVENFTG